MKLHKWITLKHPIICQSILLLVYLLHSKYWHSKYCHQMLLDNWTEQNFWKIKLVFVLVNTCLGLKLLFGISVSPLTNIFGLFWQFTEGQVSVFWFETVQLICTVVSFTSWSISNYTMPLSRRHTHTNIYTHTHTHTLTSWHTHRTHTVDTTEGSNYLCLLSRLKAQKSVLELLDPTWLGLTWQRSNLTPRQNHQRGFLSSSTFEIIGLSFFSEYFFCKTDINWQLFFDSFCYYFK